MEFSFLNIIGTIKELILTPKEFWSAKKAEKQDSSSLFVSYLLPFFVVIAVAVFAGEFFRRTDFFIEYPLLKAAREIVLFVLQYFAGVFFTRELMKTFGAEKDSIYNRLTCKNWEIRIAPLGFLFCAIRYLSTEEGCHLDHNRYHSVRR